MQHMTDIISNFATYIKFNRLVQNTMLDTERISGVTLQPNPNKLRKLNGTTATYGIRIIPYLTQPLLSISAARNSATVMS